VLAEYWEFDTDAVLAIAALDADVLSIENSKSDAKLLNVFIEEAYPRHIGPGRLQDARLGDLFERVSTHTYEISGVYDIHSPRVPAESEFKLRIEEMLQYRK
jgi:5-methyltetrahydropteroyltriglutamate--homocysteine methyltransferase